MDLKESLFWYMQVSERSLEIMRDLLDDKESEGYRAAEDQIEAKVEVLQAILEENDLTDEYQRWCKERSGQR